MGLPMEEIEALGLNAVRNGRRPFLTGNGRVQLDTYHIAGEIMGRGFGTMVAPMPVPVVGYQMLQDMRFKVNPMTEQLEDDDDDLAGPYMLTAT